MARCMATLRRQELNQMNVQVHRAVSDLTGQISLPIMRAIVGGERYARQLAALRARACLRPVTRRSAVLRRWQCCGTIGSRAHPSQ